MQQVEHSNPFLWNILMRFYVHRGMPGDSLCLYKLMLEKGACFADNYTHPILAQACSARLSGLEGMQVHGHALKLGFDSDVYVLNTLINMYVVCGRLGDARRLFDLSSALDSVSWNSILAGYVHAGDVEGAFVIFDRMPERNSIASSSVIALLGKAGRVVDARLVFDGMTERNVVSWSAMISCYEQNGMFEDAVFAFCEMNNGDRIAMDEVVMVTVLSACTHLLSIRGGVQVHGLIMRFGFESYVNLQNALIHLYSSCGDIIAAQKLFQSGQNLDQISWNSMLSGYLKLGLLTEAKGLFDSMPVKDVVSWSAMIAGFAQHDRYSETLDIFQRMQVEGVEPDETTLVSVLSACTHLSALEQGKWVQTYIRKNGIKVNIILGTSIVDMFMKCGCVGSALEAFLDMPERGVSTWNALILGLAMNGQVGSCLEKFMEMLECGMTPNEITFVAVLSACRHAGLVDEGRQYFDLMIDCYNIEPNVKHYGCMVDLLGRAGLLNEAEEMIEKMPLQPDVATWGALLGACRKFGNTQMGERVGRRLIELEPLHDGFHVLLSNMYASRGRWNDVIEVRGLMANNKVAKIPGCSMIEADGVVHEFFARDQSHPCSEQIYEMLDEIARRLEKNGYTPSINEVALDIEDEEK